MRHTSAVARVVLVSAALGVVACGAGARFGGYVDSPAMRASAEWATQFLGTPPDATIVLRMGDIADPDRARAEENVDDHVGRAFRLGSPASSRWSAADKPTTT
jgi:hypothetical protein